MLSEPTPEAARKFMREVTWEERIEGEFFDPGPGEIPVQVYTLLELFRLLKGASIFHVDFEALAAWLENVLGDQELAKEVTDVTGEYDEQRTQIIKLLETRVAQCEQVLGESEEG